MTKVSYHLSAPWSSDWNNDCLLIYDRRLLRNAVTARWIRRFKISYAVTAGESLKAAEDFPRHLSKITSLAGSFASRRLTIVVAGGGSVGDFAGFVASIFKRGVRLVHVPTTWLSALDSAHGGKNGLNVGGAKNQIGTFYPALEVHLVRAFLETQPVERAFEGAGEVLKMVLLRGLRLPAWPEGNHGLKARDVNRWMWSAVKPVVQGKMKIVSKDPLEKSGHRHLLNLGHTMGHVFEASLGIPHGVAVAYGLAFASAFSRSKKLCSSTAYEKIISHPLWTLYLPSDLYVRCLNIPEKKILGLLLQDKKRTQGQKLRFVFLKALGRPVVQEIPVALLLKEVHRQKSLLRKLYG